MKKVKPFYPNERDFRANGKVIVRIEVNLQGKVSKARSICGHPMLRSWSEAAARKWMFHPRQGKGKIKTIKGLLTFEFPPK